MDNLWNYVDDRKLVLDISGVHHSALCVKCDGLLRNASYTKCGCRFCAKCIGDYLSSGGGHLCPGCLKVGTNTDLSEDCEVVIDPASNRDVANLRLKCPHAGCSDSVEMRAMMAHLSLCGYGEVRSCLFSVVGCARTAMTEDEVDKHLREDQRSHDEMVMEFVRSCRDSDAELRRQMEEMKEKSKKKMEEKDEEMKKWMKEDMRIEVEARKTETSTKDGEMKLMNDKVAEMKTEAERIAHKMKKKDEEIQSLREEMKTLKATVDSVKRDLAKKETAELSREWKISDMDAHLDKDVRYGDEFDLGGYCIGFGTKYFTSKSGEHFIISNLVLHLSDDAALEWPLRRDIWIQLLHPVTKAVLAERKFGLRYSRDRKGDYDKPRLRLILHDSDIIIRPICSISNWDGKSLSLRCGLGPPDPL